MKINGIRCNQCGKENYTGPFHIGDGLPLGWFSLQIGGSGLDEHFCSTKCLEARVTSGNPLSVPQRPGQVVEREG